jgi:hypothetical protein
MSQSGGSPFLRTMHMLSYHAKTSSHAGMRRNLETALDWNNRLAALARFQDVLVEVASSPRFQFLGCCPRCTSTVLLTAAFDRLRRPWIISHRLMGIMRGIGGAGSGYHSEREPWVSFERIRRINNSKPPGSQSVTVSNLWTPAKAISLLCRMIACAILFTST